jgi:aldose 1-epimerase
MERLMNRKKMTLLLAICAVIGQLCGINAVGQVKARKGNVKKESFGQADGRKVDLYTLTNMQGAEVKIATYGGIIVSLKVPDRQGQLDDVVLGSDKLEGYFKAPTVYMGALVGRYANRIARGRFTLGGKEYTLATNNGENHLHGGNKGFDKVVWNARPLNTKAGPALELRYLSRDGEEGYPGNLSVRVLYTLTDKNELRIDYTASTDKETVINLTVHPYFNLAGQGNGDILNHQLLINADRFTPTDAKAIPTGELRSVKGTPFDFTKLTAIGARINETDEQLKFGNGYDHNFVLNGRMGMLRQAARVYEPTSGRVMEVWTTEPGVQLYTGNYLDSTIQAKGGKTYNQRYGFCLETQHFPDSPNKPDFPSTILRKGARYQTSTIYRFSIKR